MDELRPTKTTRLTPNTEPEKWVFNVRYSEQTMTLGHALSNITRARLKQLRLRNQDIFAWTPAYMIGVPREVVQHFLNTLPGIKSVIQGQRHLGSAKNEVMNELVKELPSGILREVKYVTTLTKPGIRTT